MAQVAEVIGVPIRRDTGRRGVVSPTTGDSSNGRSGITSTSSNTSSNGAGSVSAESRLNGNGKAYYSNTGNQQARTAITSGREFDAPGNGTAASWRRNGQLPASSVEAAVVLADRRRADMQPGRAAAASAAAAAAAELTESLASTPSLPLSSVVDVEVVQELPTDADFKWSRDNYNVWARNVDTWTFFSVFRTRLWLLEQKWSYPGGFTEDKKSLRARSLAQYLLSSILALGPTFIKVGQLSSTRSDLFPKEFVEELSKLQDRVPAFSADKAIAIIEQDLGQPVSQLYRSFDRRPIAAASLGQVHRAVLHTGEQVVVKVQRPGLKQLFDIDLNNLRILAEQLDKSDEANSDFKGIYEECASVLYKEIDYISEGRSCDEFRRNFMREQGGWVTAPTVYWQYCSPRVITLQYMPGIKITDKPRLLSAGLDLDAVARRATEAYLVQILRHGFFHADPHPGNIAVNPATGALIFYDFGMMGRIVPDIRERLLELFYGIYRKDANQVIRALTELKIIKPTGDLLSVRRALAYFIDNITAQAERQETISAIGEDLFAIAVDQPFRFPATFTFVLRAFSTLEGIGKTLNPGYQFAEVASPYAKELLDLQDAQSGRSLLLEQLQQQAVEMGTATAAMPRRIARIDDTLAQLEGGDLRLRVRVLEAERAARRAQVMQEVTLNAVAAMGLINVGSNLTVSQVGGPAAGVCWAASAVFGFLIWRGLKRVQRLDKFEKEIRN